MTLDDEVNADVARVLAAAAAALRRHTYRSHWACLWLLAGVTVLVVGFLVLRSAALGR